MDGLARIKGEVDVIVLEEARFAEVIWPIRLWARDNGGGQGTTEGGNNESRLRVPRGVPPNLRKLAFQRVGFGWHSLNVQVISLIFRVRILVRVSTVRVRTDYEWVLKNEVNVAYDCGLPFSKRLKRNWKNVPIDKADDQSDESDSQF
jgi:hypothetical protein